MPSRPISQVIKDRSFVAIPPETSLREVAEKMKTVRQGAVLVMQHRRLIGICTERDMVFKAMAGGLDPCHTTVEMIMTPDPETITTDKPFGHALHIMLEGGFRHVPVIDARGHPVGIVSSRDALGIESVEFDRECGQREAVMEIL